MANSADPDQLASSEATDLDLHCLQSLCISGFSRTRVNYGMATHKDFDALFQRETIYLSLQIGIYFSST